MEMYTKPADVLHSCETKKNRVGK